MAETRVSHAVWSEPHFPGRTVVEGDAGAQREGDHVVRAAVAGRPVGCQRGRDVVVLVASDAVRALGVGPVPLDKTFEDEVVGDKLVRPIVVRATQRERVSAAR